MNDTYNLELSFLNGEGKNKKITIRKPLDGLTEAEIAPVMQTIVEHDLFADDGIDQYAAAKSARYVRTVIDDVYEAQE